MNLYQKITKYINKIKSSDINLNDGWRGVKFLPLVLLYCFVGRYIPVAIWHLILLKWKLIDGARQFKSYTSFNIERKMS